MTNQIRITLGLQGQREVSAGLKQTAKDTEGVGSAAAGITAELKSVTDQLKAMGAAALMATQQFQRVQLEQRGLSTTADSAGQALRRQQDQTTGLGNASVRAGQQVGTLDSAVRGVVAGIGIAGLVQLGQRVFAVGNEFDALRGRVDKVSSSSEQSQARFAFVTREADRLGQAISQTADNYADFIAGTQSSGLANSTRDNIFSALNEAGKAFELTQAQIDQNFDQVIRIAGRAKVTIDDLSGSLGTNLPQTLDAVAAGLGVTTDELRQLIADGQIAGNEVLPALGAGLRLALGTDAQTQIAGATSEVQRLRNELLLLADDTSGPVTQAFGDLSAYVAELLRYERENGIGGTVRTLFAPLVDTAIAGANALTNGDLRGIGSLARSRNSARDFVQANPFTPALYNPAAGPASPFYGPGRPAVDGLVGARLLGYGQTPADPKAAREAQRLADAEMLAALREQARIAAALTRDAEQTLQSDLRREEALRERVTSARIEAALIAEQLRTGTALTGAARDLFVLQQQAQDPANALLKAELEKLAALEAQVQALRDGEDAATNAARARDRSERNSRDFLNRYQRFGENGEDPFEGNRRRRTADQGELDTRYRSARDSNAAAAQADPANARSYYDTDLELARAHAQAKEEIDRNYAEANRQVYVSMASAAANTFGALATLAEGFGRRGFAAYKAFKIAEALLRIPESASNAFNSVVGIPIVGPFLAPVAAATAVAQQLVFVNQIRNAQPAGRRFGGPVSAGQPYELNEGGISEVFRDGRSGRQYFIPGNSGEVTPARQASGSGGGGGGAAPRLQLVVNNNASNQVQVSSGAVRRGEDGAFFLDVAIDAVEDNTSPLARAIQRRSGRAAQGKFG